jgi:hypothetical protein
VGKRRRRRRGKSRASCGRLGLERRKNKDLRRQLQHEVTASIAIRMELRALKGKTDEATKLAKKLTRQRRASEEAHSEVEDDHGDGAPGGGAGAKEEMGATVTRMQSALEEAPISFEEKEIFFSL